MGNGIETPLSLILFATYGYLVPVLITIGSVVAFGRAMGARLSFGRPRVLGLTAAMLAWIWTVQLTAYAFTHWDAVQAVAGLTVHRDVPDLKDLPNETLTALGHKPAEYIPEGIRKKRDVYCMVTPTLLLSENSTEDKRAHLAKFEPSTTRMTRRSCAIFNAATRLHG